MKAVLKKKPSSGIDVEEIPDPTIEEDEVLINVKAAGICGSDVHVYEWTFGYEWMEQAMPLVIGHEMAGEIVSLGDKVENLSIGDRVICFPAKPCGNCFYCRNEKSMLCTNLLPTVLGFFKNGAFADYVAAPATSCFLMPDNLTYEEGALVEPLVVAANAAMQGKIRLADTAVVLGPGPIGLMTMIFVKEMGATNIIMVGTSKDTMRLELAKDLGADIVLVADQVDVVKQVKELTEGVGANVVFEATGVPSTIQDGLDMLQKGSSLISIGIFSEPVTINQTNFVRASNRIIGSYAGSIETWGRVINWLSKKKVDVTKIITIKGEFNDADVMFKKCLSGEAIKAMFVK